MCRRIAGDSAERVDLLCSPRTAVTALEDRGRYQAAVSSSTKPGLMVQMLQVLDDRGSTG